MKHIKISETINDLLESQKRFSDAISYDILEKCPFIVEVGALTVCTNEDRVIEAQNLNHPMQFSQKGVNIILEMIWRNGNGEIIQPIVYEGNDWYRSKLQIINESILLFQNILTN